MIRVIFGFLVLWFSLSVPVSAGSVKAPDTAFKHFLTQVTGPGKQTVSFGKNGTPVLTTGVPTLSSAGGPLTVSRPGNLPLSHGVSLSVMAVAGVPGSVIAAMISKAIPFVPYLGTGIAIYNFAMELGFNLDNSSGSVAVTKVDSSICTIGPCYEYQNSSAGVYTWHGSVQSACDSGLGHYLFSNYVMGSMASVVVAAGSGDSTNCTYLTSKGFDYSAGLGFRAVPAAESNMQPSTLQELADAIASESGWPSSSSVAAALVQAQQITGDLIETEQPKVTGPATVEGPEETTKTDKKETTKKTNYDCIYVNGATVMDGGSVICTEKVTTTETETTTNPDGSETTTEEQTTEEKPAEIDDSDSPAIDSPLPGQPSLYKRQYPDGLTGVWNTKKAQLFQTPLLQLTTNLMPTIGASNGYPSWPFPVVIGPWNFGTFDVSPPGYVWDFLKVCVILTSIFLARALIFGG